MRKYWQFFHISIGNTFAYRGPIAVWLISNVLSISVFMAIWLSASSSSGSIAGYTRSELITYYVLGLMVNWLTNWFPFYWVKDEIWDGSVVGNSLTKPLSYYWKTFAIEAGWHFVTFFVGVAATLLIGLVMHKHIIFQLPAPTAVLFVLSIIIAILLTFSLSMCMGCLAFWFTKITTIDSLIWIGRTLVGGEALPVSFLPPSVHTAAQVLPFRYMFSFPLEIYLGKLSVAQTTAGFFIQALWVAVFILLYKLLWLKGNRIYTAFGN